MTACYHTHTLTRPPYVHRNGHKTTSGMQKGPIAICKSVSPCLKGSMTGRLCIHTTSDSEPEGFFSFP